MNIELLNMIINDIIGTNFSYTSYTEQKEKTIFVKNTDTAVEVLRDALGYIDKPSVYKVLSGETKCPRNDKMEILQKMFGVSFYKMNSKKKQKRKDDFSMILNDISKKALLDMYSSTIRFFNTTTDCVEEIDKHLRELDEYRLGVPIEIFDKYTKLLKELVYNLPALELSDIFEEENRIPTPEHLNLLLFRCFERTSNAKHQFIDLAYKEFSPLVQR